MRHFFVVFAMFVLAFANAFYSLGDHEEGKDFLYNLRVTYFITLRNSDTSIIND